MRSSDIESVNMVLHEEDGEEEEDDDDDVVFLFRSIVRIEESVIIIRRIHTHGTYNVLLHKMNSITHHMNAFSFKDYAPLLR